jgi:uncharacterized protein (DUF433 family)
MQGVPLRFLWQRQQFARVPGSSRPVYEIPVLLKFCNLPKPLRPVLVRDSGTPVFRGTRVPLQLLVDSLKRGHTLEEFLEGYPTVSREMAIAALEEAQQLLSAQA